MREKLGGKIAVVDDIVAKHMKAIDVGKGTYYQMLRSANIYAEVELSNIQRIYQLAPSLF